MDLRQRARDLSLLLCGALGAYLLSVVVTARLGVWLAGLVRHSPTAWDRVALGLVALDLGKLPGLIAAAWLLARATKLPAWGNALGLTLGTYALDVAVSSMLQQWAWLWWSPGVMACRVAAAALLVWLLIMVTRRRRTD